MTKAKDGNPRDVNDAQVRVISAHAAGVWIYVFGGGPQYLTWGQLRHGTEHPDAAIAKRFAEVLREAEAVIS